MNPAQVKLIGKELQLELSSEQHALYFHGLSMLPFLREGDLVIVRPVSWEDIKRGDIVTYRREDKFPTRRVLFKGPAGLSVRCDGWPEYVDDVQADDVLGRAEARCRDGSWITSSSLEWRLVALQATGRAVVREVFSTLRIIPRTLRRAKRRSLM